MDFLELHGTEKKREGTQFVKKVVMQIQMLLLLLPELLLLLLYVLYHMCVSSSFYHLFVDFGQMTRRCHAHTQRSGKRGEKRTCRPRKTLPEGPGIHLNDQVERKKASERLM